MSEAKHYRILPGHRFNDGQRDYTSGEVIQLGDDIAAQHADKVELVEDVQTSEPGDEHAGG